MSSPRPVSTDSSRTNAVAPAGTSAPATERNAAPTLNERLENLPFTRAHGKLLGISGLGWALDAMDVGLISFVMAALIKEWQLSPTEASWLGSIGFVGMALGATFGGLLADKLGRLATLAFPRRRRGGLAGQRHLELVAIGARVTNDETVGENDTVLRLEGLRTDLHATQCAVSHNSLLNKRTKRVHSI